jgi:hypothetical protein
MRLPSPIVLTILVVMPATLAAQDLPPYVPVNPILASRSALYAQPLVPAMRGWHVRTVIDYSNAIEDDVSLDRRPYLLDAEILQADLWVTHDLSPRVFLVGEVPLRGGYDGFLDSFLNWYHDLIGIPIKGRSERPLNTFAWTFTLPDTQVTRLRPGTFIGDLRAGVGLRVGRSQLVATITAPTTPASADGWGRGVIGTSLALTSNFLRSPRVLLDGSVNLGATPKHGALSRYQRSIFAGTSLALRWRFSGNQAVFGTFWMQSANGQKTGWGSVDDAEVTLDFGGLIRFRKNWPELQLGMTEDLMPKGPAIDAGFKLGVRWR